MWGTRQWDRQTDRQCINSMHVSYIFKKVVKVCLVRERKWVSQASRQKIPPIPAIGQQNNLRLYWISFFLFAWFANIFIQMCSVGRWGSLSSAFWRHWFLRYRRSSILIENALMGNLYNVMHKMIRLAHGEKLMKIISHEKLHSNFKVLVLCLYYICALFITIRWLLKAVVVTIKLNID